MNGGKSLEWISIEDRLPEECASILLYCPATRAIAAGCLLYSTDGLPLFYQIQDFDESQDCRFEYVSHWMPLPEAPL